MEPSPAGGGGGGVLPFFLLVLLSLTPASDAEADAEKVNVTVFFETLCPDSRSFIHAQLYPVWRDLHDILEVNLYAYGKAKEVNDKPRQFHCQHGQRECEGNMMVSCAMEVIPDSCVQMEFVRCVMERYRGAEAGSMCADEAGVEYSEVQNCMSSKGAQLQHELDQKQSLLNPSLYYVPWILINDVFSPEQLKRAQQDLRAVVCEAYKGPRPEGCM